MDKELQKQVEELREYHKEYSLKNKEVKNATTKKWIANNREKFNEKMMVNYKDNKKKWLARSKAVKEIKIPKGQICIVCKENLATQRHHEDYDKPLDVDFLCKKCHGSIPKRL